jgi:hypothetical protein
MQSYLLYCVYTGYCIYTAASSDSGVDYDVIIMKLLYCHVIECDYRRSVYW